MEGGVVRAKRSFMTRRVGDDVGDVDETDLFESIFFLPRPLPTVGISGGKGAYDHDLACHGHVTVDLERGMLR